jgi:hypothetical protein
MYNMITTVTEYDVRPVLFYISFAAAATDPNLADETVCNNNNNNNIIRVLSVKM